MGLISAATKNGVESVDIQHGKQGKYSGAYSGWNLIPKGGYKIYLQNFGVGEISLFLISLVKEIKEKIIYLL